jgi:hypothetical protein
VLEPADASSQQCVCTTCQGPSCGARFWATGSDLTCPYRPPLHLVPSVTTMYAFPGETTQQPTDVAGLESAPVGNWCRFRWRGAWVAGYLRSGVCRGPTASSANFEIFCPFMVPSCASACNVKHLVNPVTRKSCSCDYWCQLYGDCCGPDPSNAVAECPTMTPSVDFSVTRSCPARTGLASQQTSCSTYRPAGTLMLYDQGCMADAALIPSATSCTLPPRNC